MKTAKDYKKEYDNLTREFFSLANHVTERLVQLAIQHPNVIIKEYKDTKVKAGNTLTRLVVEKILIEDRIEYIRIIEKWIEDQNPIKQSTIPFPE